MDFSVIIPVYKPDGEFPVLLERLQQQICKPKEILLINTEKEFFDERLVAGMKNVRVHHIKKADFDHGGTRHLGTTMTTGEVIVFLTQDAIPKDAGLFSGLLAPFYNPAVAASYARQLPRADCSDLERYTRFFNYGPKTFLKSQKDTATLGIKTYFCSNVCAAYRRSVYEALGGFERKTIFNEDMIFAGKLVQGGYSVAYCAEAKVIHSHNYSGWQQFHRNFDLGVSQAEHPEIFVGVPAEGEGLRMVKESAAFTLRIGKPWLLPVLLWQSGWKLLGYRLGKAYRRLPKSFVQFCSMNKAYWNED